MINILFNNKLSKYLNNNKKLLLFVIIFSLIIFSFIVILPFLISGKFAGDDISYHLDAINSLLIALKNGKLFPKIYDMICQDYGYGTGIFYSVIPSSIAAFLVFIGIQPIIALCLEFWLLFFLASLIVFFFVNYILKNKKISFIASILYMFSPYLYNDLYYRFSFSEIFLSLTVPLIFWGLYALLENNNYKVFFPTFITGYTLSFFIHFTLTIFIILFNIIFICFYFKKFFKQLLYIPFCFATFIVLLITSIFYVPMLANFSILKPDSLIGSIFDAYLRGFQIFSNRFLFNLILNSIIIFISAKFIFLRNKTYEVPKYVYVFFTITVIIFFMTTPFFPWFITPRFLQFIQFPWRLNLFLSLFNVVLISFIFKYCKIPKLNTILNTSLVIIYISSIYLNVQLPFYNNYRIFYGVYGNQNVECVINNEFNYESENNGIGFNRNGDYLPNKANYKYIIHRGDKYINLKKTTAQIEEVANYQITSQFSFMIESHNKSTVVTNILFNKINPNIHIYRTTKSGKKELKENDFKSENYFYNDNNFLSFNFGECQTESKLIIKYNKNDSLDNYFKKNPIEFISSNGKTIVTNFIKKDNRSYSVYLNPIAGEDTIELPSLYYRGYTLNFTNQNGKEYKITPIYGKNGFIEVKIFEKGNLSVNFNASWLTTTKIISIVGICLFFLSLLLIFLIPKKYYTNIYEKILSLCRSNSNISEILRFVIVGGIATLVDMLSMAAVMFLMQPKIYKSLFNLFFNSPSPSTFAAVLGTAIGFSIGLLINYILSITFVFNERGRSKSYKGFIFFTILSVIGLFINILGMYLGYGILHINQWIIKIIMTLIVLFYNYISKRLLIFKKAKMLN